jgi:inosine/xanthosine triphosphate pyrophosphatase family protein
MRGIIMKTILFATGNSRKISEANATLAPFGVATKPIKLDFDEIQHADSAEITKAKAKAAFAAAGGDKPVVVSDTSWSIPALGGFPSGYMKDVSIWWTAQNWLDVMASQADKRIFCLEHVAYYDGEVLQHFVEQYEGRFVPEARGRVDDMESIERVVSLYGNETMAEQLARGDIASAGETLGHWQQFGEWYSQIRD